MRVPVSITAFFFFFGSKIPYLKLFDVLCLHATAGEAKAANWPISFKKNSQTLPSIEVKLSPPEDPLPQVSAEVQLLERARMRLEEGMMAKLEDEYNIQLDKSQTRIQDSVDKAMKVFDDPAVLTGTVKGALLPITSPKEAAALGFAKHAKKGLGGIKAALPGLGEMKAALPAMPSFKQYSRNVNEHEEISHSFLELANTETQKSKFIGGSLGGVLGNPSFKVELTDVKEPDSKIKTKMDEIEQKRSDEESKLYEQAAAEFDQLTQITVQELEKNIQIQMNPFLVDSKTVGADMLRELGTPAAGATGVNPSALGQTRAAGSITPVFRQLDLESGTFMNKKCLEIQHKFPSMKLECAAHLNSAGTNSHLASSFLEEKQVSVQSQAVTGKLLPGPMEQQLNVKVGQSEHPYPTIDEIVNDMEKKRDATERLERMKILELELKLLKSQDEMIKDALHVAVSRVLAQYGPVVDSIKRELAEMTLT